MAGPGAAGFADPARHTCAALQGLEWVFAELERSNWRGLRELGTRAVGIFFEAWLDCPEEDGEMRAGAETMAEACLKVLEADHLRAVELADLLRLIWYRSELQPGAAPEIPAQLAQAASRAPARRPRLGDTSRIVSDAHAQELVRFLFPAELCKLRLESRSGMAAEPAEACPGLRDAFELAKKQSLAWPGSRAARDLDGSLGSDLVTVASIAHALNSFNADKSDATHAPWVFEYARRATAQLLESPRPDFLENVATGIDVLRGLGPEADDDPLVQRGLAWIASLAAPDGRIGLEAPRSSGFLERVRPTCAALRALRPRRAGERRQAGERYRDFGQRAAALLAEAGLAAGPLRERAPVQESWLGTPDAWSEGEGQVPVVQQSARGGPGGRGLFTVAPGCPRPLELIRDAGHGADHGFISSEESERMWESKAPGHDYIVLLMLGVWFRDEFSSGDLHGTVRPLSAALPRWLEEGRCVQGILWDADAREYILPPSGRDAFVALNAAHSLAAMANDALYGTCSSEEEYNQKDRAANNLVMVPCARPALSDPRKVEFSGIWLYPRQGWCWEQPQELTLGYGWDDPADGSGS